MLRDEIVQLGVESHQLFVSFEAFVLVTVPVLVEVLFL